MAVVKLVGLVLLVVVPGGSLVLLAIAGVRAYRQRTGPFAWLRGGSRPGWLGRLALMPHRI